MIMLRTDTVNGIVSRVWDTTAGTVTTYDASGVNGVTRAMTTAEAAAFSAIESAAAADANVETLRSRARTALTSNSAFLALAAPTNAQSLAQVQRLTKECSALIRIVPSQLDTITDTA